MKVSESETDFGQADFQSDAANVHFPCRCMRAEGRFSEDGHMFIAGLTVSGKGRVMRQERGGGQQSSLVLTWVLADGM